MQGLVKDVKTGSTSEQVLNDITKSIEDKIGSQKYQIWFRNSTRLLLSEGNLRIVVPNSFVAGWIESHFLPEINEAVLAVTGKGAMVTFTIDSKLSGNMHKGENNSNQSTIEAHSIHRNNIQAQRTRFKNQKQLKLSLDTFIVGSSNELAFNAARAIVNEQHSPFNPLFVHGGYGVGKTHLLQGICNAVCEKRPQTNWLYLSAEDFANQFVLALKTKKLEAFRRRIREMDLLAIDDIHFLASKPSTQEEFLYTFNTISLAGKQVILASDAHPKMINQLSEKLISRFVSGMVVKIDEPDIAVRCQICRQYAQKINKKRIIIPDNVINYIAENINTNVRELEGAVLKLMAFASLKNEKVTIAMAEQVLAEHIERCDPLIHVSDITSAVANYFGISSANMNSSRKNRTVALARHMSMYLTRKHTRMSSSEIGRVMGGKNHATVLLACRRVEEMLEKDSEVRWQGPTGNKVTKISIVINKLEESIAR